MAASLPPAPASLKLVQHHLKTAQEHETRDPVVAYYCKMYVLQEGIRLDKSSPEAKKFLGALMSQMEQTKSLMGNNEAIHSEVVGQAHIENYALKMFSFADTEDRASRHTKNVVKSFYTAGMLFDVLSIFGETNEDIEKFKKYAKYKAAYIHKCLKAGEMPIPGPVNEEGEDLGLGDMNIAAHFSGHAGVAHDVAGSTQPYGGAGGGGYDAGYDDQSHGQSYQQPPASTGHTISQKQKPAAAVSSAPASRPSTHSDSYSTDVGSDLHVDWEKAIKFTKYATSSMAYEDKAGAIDYLQKALNMLTKGHE